MQANDDMLELLLNIEEIVGSFVFNTHSYNRYTESKGRYIQYGLTCTIFDEWDKAEREITANYYHRNRMTMEQFRKSFYKFGVKHLQIGPALINVLTLLEERYGLDINALEAEYQKSREGQ